MQYFTDKELVKRYKVGRSTVWHWVEVGRFPEPVRLNGVTRWREVDIVKWEKDQESK